jgi:NAD(P)-dependent dehydrogenase (short-subunit alcohol dehydrogenase family)
MVSLVLAGMSGEIDTDLGGKVAVVTGATSGIGKEIARGLAGLGATVVIGSRDEQRGAATRAELVSAGRGTVSVLPLDVADQASIRAFAAAVRERHGTVDILVNNAGAWFTDRRESPGGVELTFATNVLGPYLLTSLLLDALRAAPQGRIVNVVSSIAGHYDADDLQFTRRPYAGGDAYAQSKQALRMLTFGWATELAGTAVTVNAIAPGFVRTAFNRNASGARATMINVAVRLFGTTPATGADSPLWAAAAPELASVTGTYIEKRTEKLSDFRDPATIADLQRRCAELTS